MLTKRDVLALTEAVDNEIVRLEDDRAVQLVPCAKDTTFGCSGCAFKRGSVECHSINLEGGCYPRGILYVPVLSTAQSDCGDAVVISRTMLTDMHNDLIKAYSTAPTGGPCGILLAKWIQGIPIILNEGEIR